ncbi:MAG: translocation/assembly module TamB domain-containing protein [Deltaproteobacteria bacterium]|nr:translocation/assembly module TamB domain-containing protein [Deltaproteobacteria bacterium]
MRRVVRIAVFLAVLLPLCGGVQAQVEFAAIRNKLIRLALDQISSPGSFEIQVRAIEDGDDGLTSLVGVEVSDGTGVWMEVERVGFAWEPQRLLDGELAIRRLEFFGVTVTRKPSANAELPRLKPQPPWRRGPFDWPRSPIALSLEGVRLQRVSIAEGVLPRSIRFDAEGRASDKDDLQEIVLRLRRTDAVEGRISLQLRRDFAAGTARLEAVAEEAAGGMVAALAGFPDDAPVRLQLNADGPPEDWRLSFDAAVEGAFDAKGRATVSHTGGEEVRVVVDSAQARFASESVRLGKPLHARVGIDGFEVAGFDLRLASGGNITGDLNGTAAGLHGGLTAQALSLAAMSRLAGTPVITGSLDLDAAFDTRPPKPHARLKARGRDLVFAGFDDGGVVDVDLDGEWNGARLVTRSEIRGSFDTPVRARLAMAAGADENGLPTFSRNAELEGSLAWNGRLERIWAMVPTTRHQLDGDVDIDVRVAGSPAKPRLSGHGSVTGGEYRSVDAGTVLTDLAIQAQLAGNDRIGLTATASDQDQGKLKAAGAIRLGHSVNVDLRIDDATLIRRDDITARLSGAATLDGTFEHLALRGDLRVNRAEYRLEDAPPPEVVALEGIRIEGAPEDRREDGPALLSLDLTVRSERGVFIRGRGVDSEWNTDLRVTGAPTAPVLTGTLQSVRGGLDLLGKPFDLTQGRIVFDGSPEPEPRIDVRLERTTDTHQGGLHLNGRATNPRIRFVSQSGLPEEEVLPRLLFGASRQSLTVAQAIQLSVALAQLFGEGTGFGLQERLRTAARLDDLQLSGTDADSVSVTVGKNLGDVFVGARQSLLGRRSSIVVELNLSDNLMVDSELTNERGSNIGVRWHMDF